MNNVVTTLGPSFLIGSSSFLQALRKPIIYGMGSKFGRIRPGTYELHNVLTTLLSTFLI